MDASNKEMCPLHFPNRQIGRGCYCRERRLKRIKGNFTAGFTEAFLQAVVPMQLITCSVISDASAES